jgi:hypothetical protein
MHRNVAVGREGLVRHRRLIIPRCNDLALVDCNIFAAMRLQELGQHLQEGATLALPLAARRSRRNQLRRGKNVALIHFSLPAKKTAELLR